MKNTEYKVIYDNDNETTIHAFGFTEAVILAMAYALNKGWSYETKRIESEEGIVISKIAPPTFKF